MGKRFLATLDRKVNNWRLSMISGDDMKFVEGLCRSFWVTSEDTMVVNRFTASVELEHRNDLLVEFRIAAFDPFQGNQEWFDAATHPDEVNVMIVDQH